MKTLDRITLNPEIMGGRPCIRGLRITAGMIAGLVAAGHTHLEILKLYPCLEEEDSARALTYAAWRTEEVELPHQRDELFIRQFQKAHTHDNIAAKPGESKLESGFSKVLRCATVSSLSSVPV